MNEIKKEGYEVRYNFLLKLVLVIITSVIIFQIPTHVSAANDATVFKDGIYCYLITNEETKEVRLIGIESTGVMEELHIPGTTILNNTIYSISEVDINWSYYSKEEYASFYKGVVKLNIDETFTGTIKDPYGLTNLRIIEFYGIETPKKVYISSGTPDILFIVPEGLEKAYANVIEEHMDYYIWRDLYEKTIKLTPTIVSSVTDEVEYGVFNADGFIYQVISSAKDGNGKVQLVGHTKMFGYSYLTLPEVVTNNGYTYKLTKLCQFGLIACGATVIVIPDTVTEMESDVFDKNVELLFLSKNCKVIPSRLVTDENDECHLRFVYVPEGVTTISENAFSDWMINEASIILPSTIKSLGKKSLYDFKLVTFLNKKPIKNIAPAIKNGTTVKVNCSSISAYKSVLNSKINVMASKNVVKATNLTLDKTNLKMNTLKTKKLNTTLTNGSNETVFWLSSNNDILEVSSKGVINPKKAGSAYVIAYTRTSGLHQAVKVTVTDFLIKKGIYTYKVTNALKQTVILCSIKPNATTKKLNIPETISYENKTYTVTGVIADPRNTRIPLINDKYSDNMIKEVVFPKTISGTIGYLGKMSNIKSITFKGKTAPTAICDWYADGGFLSFQAVIYVPKGCVDAYSSSLWLYNDYNVYSFLTYGCDMDFNVLETGSDQLQRFVVDGILYKVTKKAGTKRGEVAVKGADVNLRKISVGGTVTYGKYTYNVNEVYSKAFRDSNAETIILGNSITKVGTSVFNEKVKHVIWSKNCSTIKSYTFSQSSDIDRLEYVKQIELTGQSDFYALETFIIPHGVTTIQKNVFQNGFGNVASITVPASVTSIGSKTFQSITNVIYKK